MRITRDQTIAGLPAFVARDLMQELRKHTVDGEDLRWWAEHFGAENPDATVEALLAEGYVAEREDRPGHHDVTPLGVQLLRASAKVYRRATADKALAAMIERAEEINRNPDLMYSVDKLIVFGSYLDPGVDAVGDVDVAVALTKKPPRSGDEAYSKWGEERRRAASRYPGTIFEQTLWPKLEILRTLKGRSAVIQLDDADNPVLKRTETRVVYERRLGGEVDA